jgi:hypothetical protein
MLYLFRALPMIGGKQDHAVSHNAAEVCNFSGSSCLCVRYASPLAGCQRLTANGVQSMVERSMHFAAALHEELDGVFLQ